jgi:hypothetical protein
VSRGIKYASLSKPMFYSLMKERPEFWMGELLGFFVVAGDYLVAKKACSVQLSRLFNTYLCYDAIMPII